jgi:predicted DNA-binding transcriptional regulator AlpA
MNRDILYIKDLAARLNTTETAIRSALQKKSPAIPPHIKLGRRVAWRETDYQNWLQGLKAR